MGGSFLVRQSSKGGHALSVRIEGGRCEHHSLAHGGTPGSYLINGKPFRVPCPTLSSVVKELGENPGTLITIGLRIPAGRPVDTYGESSLDLTDGMTEDVEFDLDL